MLVIAGTIKVGANDIENNKDAIVKMCVESNKEAGCHAYSFSADLEVPGLIRVFECWETEQDLIDHFQTPHMDEFQKVLATLTIEGMDVQKYQIESVGPMVPPSRG